MSSKKFAQHFIELRYRVGTLMKEMWRLLWKKPYWLEFFFKKLNVIAVLYSNGIKNEQQAYFLARSGYIHSWE